MSVEGQWCHYNTAFMYLSAVRGSGPSTIISTPPPQETESMETDFAVSFFTQKASEWFSPGVVNRIKKNKAEIRELQQQKQNLEDEIDERDAAEKNLQAQLKKVRHTAKEDVHRLTREKESLKSQHQVEKKIMKSQYQVEKESMESQHQEKTDKLLRFTRKIYIREKYYRIWRVKVQAKNKYSICRKLMCRMQILWNKIGVPVGQWVRGM